MKNLNLQNFNLLINQLMSKYFQLALQLHLGNRSKTTVHFLTPKTLNNISNNKIIFKYVKQLGYKCVLT